jgi:hypothetical protein
MIIQLTRTTKRYNLTTDPDGKAWVEIRQFTYGDMMERGNATASMRYIRTDTGTAIEQDYNQYEIMALDIRLALSGAGGFVDEQGNDVTVFSFNDKKPARISMTEERFIEALNMLNMETINEIHGYVKEVNPQIDEGRSGE